MNWGKILLEAIICGIAVLVVGLIVNWIHSSMKHNKLQSVVAGFGTRNLGWLLFWTGIVVYLVAEFSGANKWYCKNGNACLTH